jgi:hypothetical protein
MQNAEFKERICSTLTNSSFLYEKDSSFIQNKKSKHKEESFSISNILHYALLHYAFI